MGRPRKPTPIRHCKFCGTVLKRKTFGDRIEDLAVFIRKVYCNRVCMARAFLKQDAGLSALHKRTKTFLGKKCEMCGTMERLGVHHINGNIKDNSPRNRMTVCDSCHTKWHWQNGKKPWKRQSVCKICQKPARKLDMCQKHYQRYGKYGDPFLTKKKIGSRFVLVRETVGGLNGLESPELPKESPTESQG